MKGVLIRDTRVSSFRRFKLSKCRLNKFQAEIKINLTVKERVPSTLIIAATTRHGKLSPASLRLSRPSGLADFAWQASFFKDLIYYLIVIPRQKPTNM